MGDADRIEATRAALEAVCREANILVSGDGRVSEADTATLIGMSQGGLKNLRHEGGGPASYRIGINGSRRSYALADLAAWLESRREDW